MAHGAHRVVLPLQPVRVEAGPVRIESPAALRRVTWQAVALGMTADARFETLPCRAAMPRNEESPGVVIPRSQAAARDESRLLVTCGAKAPLAVTVHAGRLARVGRRGMARQEAGRVIARRTGGRLPVALEAVAANMAARAARRTRRRQRGVAAREIPPMRRRSPMRDERQGSWIRGEHGDRFGRRSAGMTLIAELTCMTGRAIRRQGTPRHRAVSVAARPAGIVMRRRCGETGDIVSCETDRASERKVTGRAGRVECREMSRANLVTVQAAADNVRAYRHAGRTRFRMACRPCRRIDFRGACVPLMIEFQIAAPRLG